MKAKYKSLKKEHNIEIKHPFDWLGQYYNDGDYNDAPYGEDYQYINKSQNYYNNDSIILHRFSRWRLSKPMILGKYINMKTVYNKEILRKEKIKSLLNGKSSFESYKTTLYDIIKNKNF